MVTNKYKYIILAVVVLAAAFYFYNKKEVEIIPIANTSKNEISKALKVDDKISEQISNKIEKTNYQAPQIVYITKTQVEADNKAQELAKADKADKVLKKTTVKTDNIENKYYGIHLEKQNSIGVGATIINSKPYVSVSYEHKNIEFVAHSKDLKTIDGATILYKKRF